jgi:hypothetical protein
MAATYDTFTTHFSATGLARDWFSSIDQHLSLLFQATIDIHWSRTREVRGAFVLSSRLRHGWQFVTNAYWGRSSPNRAVGISLETPVGAGGGLDLLCRKTANCSHLVGWIRPIRSVVYVEVQYVNALLDGCVSLCYISFPSQALLLCVPILRNTKGPLTSHLEV